MTALPNAGEFDLPKAWRVPAELGFSVFPVEHGGKRPMGPWKQFQTERAPFAMLRDWASRPSNVGIATGAVSGLIVLDLDSQEAVQEAERRGLPDTITAKTGKGLHVYFRHPGGKIGNRAGLLPGWDIRGDGGYVVAPGSVHPSGTDYRWENPPGMFELADIPDWLAGMLEEPDVPDNVARLPLPADAYGNAALDGELSALRQANEGHRNEQLNKSAFALAQLVAAGLLPEGSTREHLRGTARAIGLTAPEIEATLDSGWSAGLAQPRTVERRAGGNTAAKCGSIIDPDTGEILDDDLLPTLDLAALAQVAPKPKAFILPRIAPAGEVTLFTGPGAAGKSLLAQQLATAIAAGVNTLGLELAQAPSIYVTCEDDAEQLHWRLAHICKALGVPMASLAGKLHLSSLRGGLANELATFANDGTLSPAPAYHRLVATIRATGARLVVLDNVAHLFTGNENDRGNVTRFVNLLNRVAGETGAAIILVGHPNKSGDTYSGSTAWLNAVRSQVFMDHVRDEDGAITDPDARVLTIGKPNYAQRGDPHAQAPLYTTYIPGRGLDGPPPLGDASQSWGARL